MKTKKFHLPNIHFHIRWKVVHITALIFSLTVLAGIVIFAYHYVLSTITHTQETIKLKKIVSPISFDKEELEKILQNIKNKESFFAVYDFTKIKNIFSEARITGLKTKEKSEENFKLEN